MSKTKRSNKSLIKSKEVLKFINEYPFRQPHDLRGYSRGVYDGLQMIRLFITS